MFYPLNYGESHVRDSACKRRERDGNVDSAQSIANARRIRGRNARRCTARRAAVVRNTRSEIDDDEIFLADVAQRAAPVGGNVGETGAGGDAFVGQAFCLVVDPPANQADPALVFGYFAHVALGMMKVGDAVRRVIAGRKAQCYRNFAQRLRNVVLNVRIANNSRHRVRRACSVCFVGLSI